MKSNRHLRLLSVIIILGFILRVYKINTFAPFYGDQAWFMWSAKEALTSSRLPLLGITTSITWLHQGPLWTYILIPLEKIFSFSPYIPNYLTAIFGTISLVLMYYCTRLIYNTKTALISTYILSILYFSVIQDRIAYHTSLIPLFSLIIVISLKRRWIMVSGLFLGFSFQLHILSAIFWPFVLYYILRNKFETTKYIFGFCLGILPFIISGPVQTFGVIFWLLKYLIAPPVTTGISTAYMVVAMIPVILILSKQVSRLPQTAIILLSSLFLVLNLVILGKFNFNGLSPLIGPNLAEKIVISKNILALSNTTLPRLVVPNSPRGVTSNTLPYTYLIWWQSNTGVYPSGSASAFLVDENNFSFRMLK